MKKNENIFIALQLQKNQDSKELHITVQFDKTAPNFCQENEEILWSPTTDEIEFIKEAFALVGGWEIPEKPEPCDAPSPPEEKSRSETILSGPSHRSSEIRIAPLVDNRVIEVTANSNLAHIKKREPDEKIFIQADEKKIDEILKRKKPGMDEEYVIESGEKNLIDRMLKQKKKNRNLIFYSVMILSAISYFLQ